MEVIRLLAQFSLIDNECLIRKIEMMKFKLTILITLGTLIIVTNNSFAQQDPMYTQYMFNTQTINPAYAGSWNSVGFQVLARQQWAGWEGAPKTYTFSIQAPLKNEAVALGLNVISDKVGLENRFSLFGDYSYKIMLTNSTQLRFGIKGGFTNYSNNFESYTLYPDGIEDPLFQGAIENKFLPNFGVGAFLQKEKLYIGLSIPKMIQNDFENNYNNYSGIADIRHYFLIAGYVMDLGENLKFKPTMLTKVTIGAPVEIDLSANFLLKEKLWLGGMYRTGDAVGFIIQWIFDKNLRIGYAFDYSTSNLQNFHNGTHEIMVSYELRLITKKFVSPRYF